MSVEDVLLDIANAGLQLNNLFQLQSGEWQANLRSGETCFAFGRGKSAVQALRAAMVNAPKPPKTGDVFV